MVQEAQLVQNEMTRISIYLLLHLYFLHFLWELQAAYIQDVLG